MDKPNSIKSPRGKYIISKALYIGIKKLSKEVEVFTKDEQIEGISYSNLTPFLIKAIQELKAEIELLKNK